MGGCKRIVLGCLEFAQGFPLGSCDVMKTSLSVAARQECLPFLHGHSKMTSIL